MKQPGWRNDIQNDTSEHIPCSDVSCSVSSACAHQRVQVLSVQDLTISYGDKIGVNQVGFTVDRGEVVALVGKSGAGKTTILKAIAGLLPPTAQFTHGEITVSGERVQGSDGVRRCGKELAVILQNPGTTLDPCMKVGAQIDEVICVYEGVSSRDACIRSCKALESVGLTSTERVYHSYPHELSGGQQQRVALAIALVLKPDLVIADEPTSALDTLSQRVVVDQLLKQQQEQGFGLLIVTHNIALAYEVADKIVVMKDGRVVEQGDAQSVIKNPQHSFTRELITHAPRRREGAVRSSQAVPIHAVCTASIQRKSTPHPGRTTQQAVSSAPQPSSALQPPAPSQPQSSPQVLFEATNVSYTFPGTHTPALVQAQLTVYEGERLALIGPSGAGKSVLSSLLVRRMAPTSGTLTYQGDKTAAPTLKQAGHEFWREVQMVFQDPLRSLDRDASVFEILAEPLVNYGIVPMRGFSGRLVRSRWRKSDELKARIGELLEKVELAPEYMGYQLRELSGGQQQRVALARALAIKPRCLILDEAFSGFDTITQSKILDLLKDLQNQKRQEGSPLTLIVVDHDICRVSSFADRIILVEEGKAGADTSTDTAVEKLIEAAYALPEAR